MPVVALTPLVSMDGRDLAERWLEQLVELQVERQFQVPGWCRLRFSDPGYELLQTNEVRLGRSIEVADPADRSAALIEAEVTGIEVDQRVGEQPELVIVAQDRSHRLGRGTEVRSYVQMSSSQVVSALASRCGFEADVTSTDLKVDYLMQADSDLGLLTELARRVGFDWWVDGDTLHFHPPSQTAEKAGRVTLSAGFDLLSFSARATGQRPDAVTVDGWNRNQQEVVTATAHAPSTAVVADSPFAGLVEHPGDAFGHATVTTVRMSAQSTTEATELSKALLDHAAASSVTTVGVALGNPHIKLGTRVIVGEAGPLSGAYPVTRVEHLFRSGSGFRTRFHTGERRPSGLVETLSGSHGAARPATLHPGLSVGQVTNINDPEHKGRVKVRYPGLSDKEETGWARIVGVGGGAQRGTVFVPEVNDEVLVGFEGGDPRQPVVIGGLYGAKSTIPRPLIKDGKVAERGITSRLGHVVRLVDGESLAEQAIELQLAGGEHTLHLGKDKVAITVPSEAPVEITAGSSRITLAKDGTASLKAASVSITGDEKIELSAPQIKLNASSQLSLQSDAMTSVKAGATMSIRSDGPLSANGTPVSIN